MTPRQRRILHLAERTYPGHAPTRQPGSEGLRFVIPGGNANGRNPAAHRVRVIQGFVEVDHSLDVGEPIETGELKTRVRFINHRPSGGGFTGQICVSSEAEARTR